MTIHKQLKILFLLITGGVLYSCIELAARGYTHWTMFFLGGVCFVLLGLLNEFIPWEWAITTQALVGAVMITIAEFLSGCVLNLWLGWDVWSYSEKPYNLLGQICAENCFYWFLLSFVGIILDDFLRYWLFKEEKPYYRL